MRIKFKASTMPAYKGHDGQGNIVSLEKGDEAVVTDSVGKILLMRYRGNFEIVAESEEASRLVPDADKQVNASKKSKLKLRVKY
jgi:hypothetical protein